MLTCVDAPASASLPTVTMVVVTANSMPHLEECFGSMLDQSYPNYRVLVIDSHSSDGTVEWIRTRFPQVQVIALDENVGYRKGNALAMRLADSDYVVVGNHDIEVDRDCLANLVRAMEEDPQLGIATPKILFFDRRQTINQAGNTLHYTGTYGSRGIESPEQAFNAPEDLATMSGCCFIVGRRVLLETGGFSTDFDQLETGWHASYEDVDLAWRTRLLGYRIGYVPSAVVYHKHRRKPPTPQMFLSYEWGRYLMILRNYSARSLWCLTPALLVLEAMTWTYAALRGWVWLAAKGKALGWLLTHREAVREMRARVQATRAVPDKVIVEKMSPTIPMKHLVPWRWGAAALERVVNWMFAAYYRVFVLALRLMAAPGKSL